MLIERRLHDGIQDGSITVLFRRWRAPQAVAGKVYRTAAGRIVVDEVTVVPLARITARDARAAGYRSADEVRADLRGDPMSPVYRLRVHPDHGTDPRDELAGTADLTPADVEAITARLTRLDRASAIGPWTGATLRLIAERPAVRAADLAASVGRETAPFKLDVRKLKNLGLTISLDTGYRLSPRGRAYLAHAAHTTGNR
ncbi:hypothetical protein [Actinokineospora sp. NBRC 105648]|uniref:hypothetical protein n=1 Tax=Actinokineospora sp. NBRC 105648 TaxID=3032206 RepID=UPI00249F9B17|nr:hypothetical protein [Actinokineospora sp. NBRC 105648]GLZ36829.1 hypothetical protein Acsp05_04540 [Actinokineospora sp. NBRC 105648]